MPLSDEIDQRRKEIHTDAYPMSVGELASIYEQGELEIHPEFQRFFRWSISQKSRWIESLLLGIPTPSIFVAQRSDGIWDVVDGLQRLSTIFEFMGMLRDEQGELLRPAQLEGTKYLPSLELKKWHDRHDEPNSLTEEQRRFLKRAKLDIKIIERESHESSKYELFQRLNTGGSTLSDQELRNCILISANRSFFEWLLAMSRYDAFLTCVPLPERLINEQFHLELTLRFVLFRSVSNAGLGGIRNLGDYLTDQSILLAESRDFPLEQEEAAFKGTFDLLREALGEDSFRKYDAEQNRFKGATLVSAFEVVALGLGFHYPQRFSSLTPAEVQEKVKSLWSGTRAQIVTSTGESAPSRIPRTIQLGRRLFES